MIAAALAIQACAAAPERTPRQSLLSGLVAPPSFISPAYWDYHPRQGPKQITAHQLVGAGELLLTEKGERWLSSTSEAQVASVLASEPLAAAVDRGAQGWLFVGARGSTYVARSPLGDFERVTHPPTPLAQVSVARDVLVGVTRTQGLVRSTDLGATWQPVAVDGRVADVELLDDGHGLLLLTPERMLETRDWGEHWQASTEPRFGALSLEPREGAIAVHGVLANRKYGRRREASGAASSTADEPWVWSSDTTEAQRTSHAVKLAQRPSAQALVAGRAAFTQGRYYELESNDGWRLWAGAETGVLHAGPVAALRECKDLKLSAMGERLLAACAERTERVSEIAIFSSSDAGKTWHEEDYPLRGAFDSVRMALLADGRWLVSGVCSPETRDDACSDWGVFANRAQPKLGAQASRLEADDSIAKSAQAKSKAQRLVQVSVPLLAGSPYAMTADPEGRHVVLVGRRTKGREISVFTSDEQLRDFHTERLLEAEFDTSDLERNNPIGSLAYGADGNLGLTLFDRAFGDWVLLTLDAEGRLLLRGRPPAGGAVVAQAGAFAFGFEPRDGNSWESLDGGVSWKSIGKAPSNTCDKAQSRCSASVACWANGCVVDDRFSRIGWRGQQGNEGETAALSQAPSEAPPTDALASPIGCRFVENSQWQHFPGDRLPSIAQAQLKDVGWYSIEADFEHGSAGVYAVGDGPTAEVERVSLFDPHNPVKEVALAVEPQVEGVAALRVIEGHAPEVAWQNLFESRRTEHGQLPQKLKFLAPGSARLGARLLQPGLLSVSRGGLFVRAESPNVSAPSYFVSAGKAIPIPELAWPRVDKTARAEMVYSDGEPLALTMLESGAALLRARYKAGAWQRDAVTLGLHHPELFDIRQTFDLSYSATRPGFDLLFLDTEHSTGWWFPFSAGAEPLGEAVAIPTQADLPDAPRTCSEPERENTPRVIVPSEHGSRHAVIVTHTTEPLAALATQEAILYGQPKSACLAVYVASPTTALPGEEVRALVVPDPGHGSWLFKRGVGAIEFEARRMTCRFDSGLDTSAETPVGSSP